MSHKNHRRGQHCSILFPNIFLLLNRPLIRSNVRIISRFNIWKNISIDNVLNEHHSEIVWNMKESNSGVCFIYDLSISFFWRNLLVSQPRQVFSHFVKLIQYVATTNLCTRSFGYNVIEVIYAMFYEVQTYSIWVHEYLFCQYFRSWMKNIRAINWCRGSLLSVQLPFPLFCCPSWHLTYCDILLHCHPGQWNLSWSPSHRVCNR